MRLFDLCNSLSDFDTTAVKICITEWRKYYLPFMNKHMYGNTFMHFLFCFICVTCVIWVFIITDILMNDTVSWKTVIKFFASDPTCHQIFRCPLWVKRAQFQTVYMRTRGSQSYSGQRQPSLFWILAVSQKRQLLKGCRWQYHTLCCFQHCEPVFGFVFCCVMVKAYHKYPKIRKRLHPP